MNKLLKFIRLSFESIISNIGSLIILIILMVFSVIAFNRIIGYIRYQNQLSSTYFKSDLDNAIAYINIYMSQIEQSFVDNKDWLYEKQAIESIEGVKGVGDKCFMLYNFPLEKSKWFEYTNPDGSTAVEKFYRSGIEIYDEIYAESCYIPLVKGHQLTDTDYLPEDVNPIIVSDDMLEYFPLGETREINLNGKSSINNSDDESNWSETIKVQAVGVIKEGAPIIELLGGTSGYNTITLSNLIGFVRDTGDIVIMKMPDEYKDQIMKYGYMLNNSRIVQVKEGYDPSDVAREYLKLGDSVGATTMKPLVDKMKDRYKRDIASYLFDFIIYTVMSLVSIGGFYALSQRRQREKLSIYYLNGASWKMCIALDIIRNILVVAIPGIFAMLVERIRLIFTYDSEAGRKLVDFLVNVLKMDENKATGLILKYGLRTGTNNIITDSGTYIDGYSFLYSFLLIAGIYILSSAWFHFSMARTKPAEELRNWQ